MFLLHSTNVLSNLFINENAGFLSSSDYFLKSVIMTFKYWEK